MKQPKIYVVDDKRRCSICLEWKPNTEEHFKSKSERFKRELKPLNDIHAMKVCIPCLLVRYKVDQPVKKRNNDDDDAKISSWPFEPGSFCPVSQKYLTMSMISYE